MVGTRTIPGLHFDIPTLFAGTFRGDFNFKVASLGAGVTLVRLLAAARPFRPLQFTVYRTSNLVARPLLPGFVRARFWVLGLDVEAVLTTFCSAGSGTAGPLAPVGAAEVGAGKVVTGIRFRIGQSARSPFFVRFLSDVGSAGTGTSCTTRSGTRSPFIPFPLAIKRHGVYGNFEKVICGERIRGHTRFCHSHSHVASLLTGNVRFENDGDGECTSRSRGNIFSCWGPTNVWTITGGGHSKEHISLSFGVVGVVVTRLDTRQLNVKRNCVNAGDLVRHRVEFRRVAKVGVATLRISHNLDASFFPS